MKFESEEKYEDYLYQLFKDAGWQVYRQVEATETEHWPQPMKLDLMIKKEDVLNGQWIGIELKNFSGLTKGSEFSSAIKQIKRYSMLTFNGHRIKYWCLGVPQDNLKYDWISNTENKTTLNFINNFVISMGIGVLIDYSINFCFNDGKGIIDIFNVRDHKHDCKFIDNIVSELNEWSVKLK